VDPAPRRDESSTTTNGRGKGHSPDERRNFQHSFEEDEGKEKDKACKKEKRQGTD